jgi:TonB family protein
MIFSRRFSLATISVYLFCSLAAAQTDNEARAAKQENFASQALPKAFTCPRPSVLGNVSLQIVIDTKGNVSEAKALDGPEELMPAAEACAKTWKYENPPSAPVLKNVLIRYESKDCPGSESQRGELQYSWGLRDRYNHLLAFVEGAEPPPLLYPDAERKAGIAGSLVLSVPLNADGSVKEIRVMKGLSPTLDKAVMDRLRALKFKLVDGVSEMQLADARFQIIFHATCLVETVSNEN